MSEFFIYMIGVLFGCLLMLGALSSVAPVTMYQVGYALEKCEPNGGLEDISRFSERKFSCKNGAKFTFPKE